MIFDSTKMQTLRTKWIREPDSLVPRIVWLDRSDRCDGERQLLEELVQTVDESKARQWIGGLLSGSEIRFMSAWFEMLLYHWLRKIGSVEVEPDIEGNRPDFGLTLNGSLVAIEARASLLKQSERDYRTRESELYHVLRQIELPFMVEVTEFEVPDMFDSGEFAVELEQWLSSSPDTQFAYQDRRGNRVGLSATRLPSLDKIGVAGPFRTLSARPERVKSPLKKKAGQHKALRDKGYPYVIAILLESILLSVEEVVEAWLGEQQMVIDVVSGQVVDHVTDRCGLHFFADRIRHTTVSGTLAFKIRYNHLFKRRELRAWYVENPYAAVPIDPMLFPVESRFVVVERASSQVSMRWQPEDVT